MRGELRGLKRDLYSGKAMAPISCSKPSASQLVQLSTIFSRDAVGLVPGMRH